SERDKEISQEFRRGDLVARLDDKHIVVLLDAVNRATLVSRMQTLGQKFNLRSTRSRIACMEFPIDGRGLDDLMTGGRRILERVTAENGPWVVGADWRPHNERPADVFILDPDETLGAVLRSTMERRGLRTEHETDSLEGLKYLTGGTDRPLPRLLLIELEQRGIGGLQFLRQVQASGRLGQMKTIVFSARTIEGEMRQAFELGAEDYVAKPFSTPLLLHRIQRALGHT
ncbi:MAG: response regulator, partial [Acidimicrobiales bacterium]